MGSGPDVRAEGGCNNGRMGKSMARRKHRPQRTCVGCREVQGKSSLIRLVRTPAGVVVDLNGKEPGRGAYLHDRRECWEKGLRGSLERSLRTRLSDREKEQLRIFMDETIGSAEHQE
jgi:hypothetical protein